MSETEDTAMYDQVLNELLDADREAFQAWADSRDDLEVSVL